MTTTEAKSLVFGSTYEEKQLAVVDCMLLFWRDVNYDSPGFTGYDTLQKTLNTADDDTLANIAQAILNRRAHNNN